MGRLSFLSFPGWGLFFLGASLFSRRLCSLLYARFCSWTFGCYGQTLPSLLARGFWNYELGGWAPPWGIELVETPFNALLCGFCLGGSSWPGSTPVGSACRGPREPAGKDGFSPFFSFSRERRWASFAQGRFFPLPAIGSPGDLLGGNPSFAQPQGGALDAFRVLLWGSAAATLYLLGVIVPRRVRWHGPVGRSARPIFHLQNPGSSPGRGFFPVSPGPFPRSFPCPPFSAGF